MESNSKPHKKLPHSNHATVSLDSLLGVLSSAYGTEELDSNTIFQENVVDWQNLSVENFQNAPRKQDVDNRVKRLKSKDEKASVATSTTSLKPTQSNEKDLDVTLVTIKSLECLKVMVSKLEEDGGVLTKINEEQNQTAEEGEEQVVTPFHSSTCVNPDQLHIDNQNLVGDAFGKGLAEGEDRKPICGFFIDDSNNRLIFDIKFFKHTKFDHKVMPSINIEGPDISLNVFDIMKETKSCIKISKTCLVSNLKYFSDVDREFGLKNLEISVKCNLNVFLWVIQWIKADLAMCKPNLNPGSLKHVLSMAYHLGIDELLEECLDYFHENCKIVLETDWDTEDVFDDELFMRFVKKCTHSDIDEINDYFESFKSKIYCSLIQMLAEKKPESRLGHYSTLSTVFQCGHCEKLMHYSLKNAVPCRKDCNMLDEFGNLIPSHEVSQFWNLSRYIEMMFEKLNSWKLVYWKLWGVCHYFFCNKCNVWYPLVQHEWCPYHSAEVEYFPINSNSFYPVGTRKCCGEKAFRFNALKPYGGCQFTIHSPGLETEENLAIYSIYDTYKHLIRCTSPESTLPKRFVKFVKKPAEGELVQNDNPVETFWWEGIKLAPIDKEDYSLISRRVLDTLRNRPQEVRPSQNCKAFSYNLLVPFGVMPNVTSLTPDGLETSSDVNFPKSKKKQKSTVKKPKVSAVLGKTKTKKKKSSFLYQPTEYVWVNSDPNKDNQDNQRDFEEIAMRNLVKMLSPEEASCSVSHLQPTAGSYIRLENEWWQENCGELKTAGTSKSTGTVVNRTFPLSWFRRLTI